MSGPTFRIVDITRRAYGSLLGFKNLFHQAALPAVLLFAVEETSVRLSGEDSSLTVAAILLVLRLVIAMTVMLGWSRYVLAAEAPPSLPIPRFTRRELLFLGYSVAFAILVYGPSAIAVTAASYLEDFPGASIAAMLIGLAVSVALGPRLSLIFPLVALDRSDPIRTAWVASRGHTLKLTGVWVVVALPVVLALSVFGFVLPDPDEAALAFSAVYTIGGVTWLCLSAATSSYAARALLPEL